MNDKPGQTPLRIKIAFKVESLLYKLGEFACWLRKQHIFIESKDAPVNDRFCITCKRWKSELRA